MKAITIRGKKLSPLLLICLALIGTVGVGAIARYLYERAGSANVVIVPDIPNPYETVLKEDGVPDPTIDFYGEVGAYIGDLNPPATYEFVELFSCSSYALDLVNPDPALGVWVYMTVEGMTNGVMTLYVSYDNAVTWEIYDVMTVATPETTIPLIYLPGETRHVIKFGWLPSDVGALILNFDFLGEDSARP